VILVAQKNSNDSLEQKKAKKQNQEKSNDSFGNKHTDGPNHPST
jgi:hypothetical protein